MANDFTARVAGISVELGMSVQNKSGIWCNLNTQNSPQEALNAQGATIPQPEQ